MNLYSFIDLLIVEIMSYSRFLHIFIEQTYFEFLSEVLVTRFCPYSSPPGSSVHGILQARILEWVAVPFSSGFSWPRYWTQVSCIAGRSFTIWATREDPTRY